MFRVIVTVLGLELLSACVENRPYRLGGIADEFYPNQKPPFEQSTVSARTKIIDFHSSSLMSEVTFGIAGSLAKQVELFVHQRSRPS